MVLVATFAYHSSIFSPIAFWDLENTFWYLSTSTKIELPKLLAVASVSLC